MWIRSELERKGRAMGNKGELVSKVRPKALSGVKGLTLLVAVARVRRRLRGDPWLAARQSTLSVVGEAALEMMCWSSGVGERTALVLAAVGARESS